MQIMAIEKFIVLAYGDIEKLEEHRLTYDLLELPSSPNSMISHLNGSYILEVGPYQDDEILALNYMILKQTFPHAVVVEREGQEKNSLQQKPVAQVDQTLWVGLFGLAFVGILFMFLSSDQMKKLKEEHEKLKRRHQKLEERQHYVLATMGENIQNIAQETIDHTELIAEKVKDTPLHKDITKVIHHENELLDVTDDLIKFLRLKSKKVVIQNELFNFNHVLNEVAGLLHYAHKQNDTELIFEIDKRVPKLILADSLQLGQVLTNMLEYLIQNTQGSEIKLEVHVVSSKGKQKELHFELDTDIIIDNSEHLFNAYYDETSKRYVGLGLFVAQELTHLMEGELLVVDRENGKNGFLLRLPIKEEGKDKRKYRLPHKGLVGKRVLIVDRSADAAQATGKLFGYFKAEVTILSAKRFSQYMPSFEEYDIVALSNSLFSFKIIAALSGLKRAQGLKVISLDNLFSSEHIFLHDAIDLRLKKPLTQEYIFDTLIELYQSKEEDVIDIYPEEEEANAPLAPYRSVIHGTKDVDLESFKYFRGTHILIVEDNVINQKVLMSILGKSGTVIHIANNGKEAVDFMRSSNMPIGFIFMDINMPIMDGYRATELIRSDQRFNQVPIVALTALVSDHEIEKMFDMGVTAYIPKPIRLDKIYSVLKLFLSKEHKEPLGSKGVLPRDTLEEMNHNTSLPKKPEVVNFDGLDVKVGLENMKGNVISYKEVLREFLDAYERSDETFANLVKEQRFGQVKILCFDMKGLTSSIGAREMHLLINEIYQHLIYKKPELLHSYVSNYKATFLTLKKSIESYLES
jgi:two-component system sensor histidine kinase/response regulator